ncbi:Uncharacterised protein [Metamycoplasma arthritidis]|uniref:p60-related lipoprotein n=1 Tax=Metamycoplasma arthritidis (strain 158L3-1) TaxID=243272 RepID=B3PM10_META1|nr:hypothetical protein [Metamycoplasma arthritidis]ACF07062.1 P60-related lipoprotein [Metamycoplasma arthritidis 158L3-1]VEU78590.1 Uncharacterised protein [Metamycoplasma arthritidis]
MKPFNKKLLSSLLIPSVALPLATISAACATSKTRGTQSNIIKQATSQNRIITTLTNFYLDYFYANDIAAANLTEEEKKDPLAALLQKPSSQFYKDMYELFKIYANAQLDKDPQFFSAIRSELINAEIDTSSYKIAPFATPTEDDFKYLMKNSKYIVSDIRLQLQKLILIRLHMLKDREEIRKYANNKDGEDKVKRERLNKLIKDHKGKDKDKKTTEHELHEALDFKDNNVNLIEHLVNNPLLQTWAFTDKRDMQLRRYQSRIHSADEFNKIAEYNPLNSPLYEVNPKAKHPEQLISTGKNENIDLAKLRAYKGLVKASSGSADLSTTLYAIKRQKSSIFGFVDPTTSKVYSQDLFTFGKLLRQEDKAPKAKFKAGVADQLKNKSKTSISNEDIELEGTTQLVEDGKVIGFQKTVTLDSKTYTFLFKVESITYDLTKSNDVTIKFALTVKELEKRAELKFDSLLKNFEDEKESNKYNQSQYPTDVDLFKNDSFDARYIVKLVPSWTEDTKLKRKTLSFRETPWESGSEIKKIANAIAFLDTSNLFKKAVKYFAEIGFKIQERQLDNDVRDILKKEGLI